MYAKVVTPAIITQEWLDQAFSPLMNYLNQEHSERKDRILSNMMFIGNADEKFYYKNRLTRSYIVFDQSGKKQYCAEDALIEAW
ncbi:hypothetical protein [Paenibacillus prosopidis]|uniref:Uncharacterized protein n=1 Tax=Paenibacillus prosopidis TaxID=630520 RepID=A0A368W0J8_9BACL|nr:hypothetical protein [Paenibacillus prosopidis]RCW47980.1 hypothetical protein DFP97_107182 [Paenibacillus prosopidis]